MIEVRVELKKPNEKVRFHHALCVRIVFRAETVVTCCQ